MRGAQRLRTAGRLRPGLLNGQRVAPVTDTAEPLVRQVVGGVGAMRPAAREVAAWLQAAGLDDRRLDGVELAVHEVLANAFEHGHLADPHVPVEVRAVPVALGAEVVVTDRALDGRWDVPPVCDAAAAGPPAVVPHTRGRGLALAAAAVDGLDVRQADGCTVVTLRVELC